MHIRYHLSVDLYQVVKHKPRELNQTARVRLQTLTAWQALREVVDHVLQHTLLPENIHV